MVDVTVCGIRHHGPGSARSVATVLEQVRPTVVVIEGPPELDAVAALAGDADMVPPVAALVHRPDRPARALFYPMASFSPEWVALRWAMANGAQVRFADLPAKHLLAMTDRDRGPDLEDDPDTAAEAPEDTGPTPTPVRLDPIGELATAAGYADAERWWEDAVEHRHTAAEGFAVITEAIAAIRDGHPDDLHNARREAAMRRVLRSVLKAADGPVVVVCGAFHAPAVTPDRFPTAAADTRLLKGLPRTPVAATWVPWTAGRLATASGYGAGVDSPGWYDHCHTVEEDARVQTWMVKVARALREEDLPASPAAAVEAARLAMTLASIRGRPHAGLAECTDAALAVLCGGATAPLAVIHDRVVVGHGIGSVPDGTPQVPLARDLDAAARSARLRRTAEEKSTVLDLRTPSGLARSVLLHRLVLLGIPWGRPVDAGPTTGTFKEGWIVAWRPELAVAVIEASVWGSTVVEAATARAVVAARDAADLKAVADVLGDCLPADLSDATAVIVAEVDRRAATTHDTMALMGATAPLAATCRYGDVRQLDTTHLRDVLDVLIRRIAAGLGVATTGLDDDAAAIARAGIDSVVAAVRLLRHEALDAIWLDALARLVDAARVHPSITGRVVRLLLDHGRLDASDAAARLSRELSPGRPARDAAAWVDGFLDGDATLLLLDPVLLDLIDGWVTTTASDVLEDLLPLLRRTFARYSPHERNQVGSRIRHGRRVQQAEGEVDAERAAPAVAHVLQLLGGGG